MENFLRSPLISEMINVKLLIKFKIKIIQQYFHRVTCFFASLNDQNSVLDIESKTQKHSLFIGRNSFGNISF